MDNLSPIEGQDQEDVEGFESRAVNGEKVDGNNLRHMIADESIPGLRRSAIGFDHIFCNGRFTHIKS